MTEFWVGFIIGGSAANLVWILVTWISVGSVRDQD